MVEHCGAGDGRQRLRPQPDANDITTGRTDGVRGNTRSEPDAGRVRPREGRGRPALPDAGHGLRQRQRLHERDRLRLLPLQRSGPKSGLMSWCEPPSANASPRCGGSNACSCEAAGGGGRKPRLFGGAATQTRSLSHSGAVSDYSFVARGLARTSLESRWQRQQCVELL